MAQPAQPQGQRVDPNVLMRRIADQLGMPPEELARAPRTTKWMKMAVGEPLPGELGKIYVILAFFHGCKGDYGEDGLRVPQEQRVYAFPLIDSVPFLRLTYVPGWWGNDARHETMDQAAFLDDVVEEFELAYDLGGDPDDPGEEDAVRVCTGCSEETEDDDAEYCSGCGLKLPPVPETAPEPPGAQPS